MVTPPVDTNTGDTAPLTTSFHSPASTGEVEQAVHAAAQVEREAELAEREAAQAEREAEREAERAEQEAERAEQEAERAEREAELAERQDGQEAIVAAAPDDSEPEPEFDTSSLPSADAQRLHILEALERGEIDVDEALATIEREEARRA